MPGDKFTTSLGNLIVNYSHLKSHILFWNVFKFILKQIESCCRFASYDEVSTSFVWGFSFLPCWCCCERWDKRKKERNAFLDGAQFLSGESLKPTIYSRNTSLRSSVNNITFDHSGHESQLKTHSEPWQHIARDNKSLILHSPNSGNLTKMLLPWWDQTSMMGHQLFLRTRADLLWHQQPPVVINISICRKQQDWIFTLVYCVSTIIFNTALSYLLGEKISFSFTDKKTWAFIYDILLQKSNYQH